MAAFDVEDVEFLSHNGKPLFARLYVPHGPGPFRIVVEFHGGVWTLNDRTHTEPVHRALAAAGIAVAALDFRQGADGAYPLSVADAHYGIRWVKANAARMKGDANSVGVSGQSSGGHIALLIAMRPNDPRYSAIKLPAGSPQVDASFHCLNLFWPVVNPAGRYRLAKKLSGEANAPDWAVRHPALHDAYWGTEQAMTEGSPLVGLEQGEKVRLPPARWIQPKVDQQHIYVDPASSTPVTDLDKFLAAYRKAGGTIDISYYDAPQYFTTTDPTSAASHRAFAETIDFFRRHIPDPAMSRGAMAATTA